MKKILKTLTVFLVFLLIFSPTLNADEIDPLEQAEIYMELTNRYDVSTDDIEDLNYKILQVIRGGVDYELIIDWVDDHDYDQLSRNIEVLKKALDDNYPLEEVLESIKNDDIYIPEPNEMNRNINLNIASLTDNIIKVEVTSKNHLNKALELYIENEEYNHKKEVEIGETITFKNLDRDTIYNITLKNDDLVLEELSLKTFDNSDQELELFYLIDATNTSKQELKVDIFGYQNTSEDLLLNRYFGHYFQNPPEIKKNKMKVDNNIEIGDGEEIEVYIKDSDFFRISYVIDKSLADKDIGYLDEHYLMTTIDQILILPNPKINIHFWDYEIDMAIKGHFNTLPLWEYDLGFEVENDIINFLKDIPRSYLESAQIFGFHDNHFNINNKNIVGTDVKVITEKSLGSVYDTVFEVYKYFAELWGDKPSYNIDDKYSVMLVDDNRNIWGGENDTHQGYAFHRYGGEYNYMLSHQIYHRWNGWHRGIDLDPKMNHDDFWVDGFWTEGFTSYYEWKVYEDLGYLNNEIPYYDWYQDIRGTDKDKPILEVSSNDSFRLVYNKGAILAYALDREIQKLSNGEHSLDDLLKYSWQKYQEEENQINYEFILDYLINDLEIPEIELWWQKHIIDNEPVYIEEWE